MSHIQELFSYHIKDIVNKDVKQLDNDASHI